MSDHLRMTLDTTTTPDDLIQVSARVYNELRADRDEADRAMRGAVVTANVTDQKLHEARLQLTRDAEAVQRLVAVVWEWQQATTAFRVLDDNTPNLNFLEAAWQCEKARAAVQDFDLTSLKKD